MALNFLKKKDNKNIYNLCIHKKLDKWLKTAPKSITGYDVVLDDNNAYVKVYFNEVIFNTEISFISRDLSDALEGESLKFKGINVYNDNNEVCFTFERIK